MTCDPKTDVRRRFRAGRRNFVAGLSYDSRAALQLSLAGFAAPVTGRAGITASYAATGAEINPAQIEVKLRHLAFPRVSGDRLSFHLAACKTLTPGFGTIPEPAPAAPTVTPDLVLVPLIAATPDGRRLGQGGGFYDRALHRLRAAGAVVAVGLAWDVQVTDDLPGDPWDERLDWLATPSRLVDCRRYR